jgi:hypothetical protein
MNQGGDNLNEGTQELIRLADRLTNYVYDYDSLNQEEIRARLHAIDRCRHWYQIYADNRAEIVRMEGELKRRFIEPQSFPAIHPDWLPEVR